MRYQLGPEYISDRAAAVGDSITMQIGALAKQMKAEGEDVISFSQGEPDFDTPESIKAAGIEAIQQGKTKYTAASGIPELKQAIIAKLQRDQGLDYKEENILVSCGAKQSIFNAHMALLNPGDEVIIPAPFWVSYPEQVVLAGGVPVVAKTSSENWFKLVPENLEKAISKKSKVLILCSPSNPTGMLYSKFEYKALAELILDNDLIVYSDEIYEKLVYGSMKHVSIAQISRELRKRTVIINGVSKAYSMTGWRIGYMAASSSIISAASKVQAQSTSNPTTASQWAAVQALNQPEDDVHKMTAAFDKRRMYMVKILTTATDLQFFIPHGAFYIFASIKAYIGLSCSKGKIEDSTGFCSYLLQEKKIATVPGICFGMENFIRLSYSNSMEEIETGITRLSDWLQTLE